MGGHNKRFRAHITDGVMIDILSRLPTKSLHRFGCVSKAWGTLISHTRSQRRTLLPMSGLFFNTGGPGCLQISRFYAAARGEQREDYCTNFESRLRAMPCLSTSCLIHGCNGLFLFALAHNDHEIYSYFVCNPATAECVVLPDRRRKNSFPYCFLAFEPRESPHYKVFRFSLEHGESIILEIYSSVTGEWVELSLPHERPLCIHWMRGSVFLNGALHMLDLPSHLVRFDVKSGCFRMLSLPREPPTAKLQRACIGKSRGHLYYAAVYSTRLELQIWMLGGEGNAERWLLKHSTGTQIFSEHKSEPVHNLQPLAFHPDSAVIYLGIPGKILYYHPDSGKLEVEKMINYEDYGSWTTVFTVTPSLESIDPPGSSVLR